MKIREVELKSKVIIAPMAGVTNKPFRKVLRKHMKGLICSEMVSDKALCFKNEKTLEMINVDLNEGQISMQVFGGEVATMVEAAKYIDEHCNCTFIDINMGCPVKKVVKTGGGAKLSTTPDLAFQIVSEIVKAVKKPVTVKMRTGWDIDSINYIEMGLLIQKAGAVALALHGRTRAQFYEGKANWDYIADLKKHLDIPVIGNGDVASLDDAIKMIEHTNVDAIMIGRGVLGNPWLAAQIEHYFETGLRLADPTPREKIEQAIEHLDLLMEDTSEKIAVTQMRSHGAWYLRGLNENARVRREINQVQTYQGMVNIFNDYIDFLESENINN